VDTNKKLTNGIIFAYIIIFFGVWSIRELIIRPLFLNTLDDVTFQFVETGIKLLVWTLPAVLLIRYYRADMSIGLKEMFTTKPKWLVVIPFLAIVIFVPILQAFIYSGTIAIRPDFVPIGLMQSVIFAGVTEELVYRGVLLNTFLTKMKMWQAIALDAVLFYLIHFPIWIYQGQNVSFFLLASITVMGLSVLFALSFIKTRNIIVPIVVHMLWNLLVVTLYFG